MERQIIFRGLTPEGKWVYGTIIKIGLKVFMCPILTKEEAESVDYFISDGYIDDLLIEVIPESVGQYIGLKDKEGKEIYEGDIVNILHPCWTEKTIIKFLEASFIFQQIKKHPKNDGRVNLSGRDILRSGWKYEVISNIHEATPEQLKEWGVEK